MTSKGSRLKIVFMFCQTCYFRSLPTFEKEGRALALSGKGFFEFSDETSQFFNLAGLRAGAPFVSQVEVGFDLLVF